MGGKILKDGAAISLCAVTECRVLEPQKKRERENETDALFAQHKSLWLTAKYLFLFTCTQAGIHNFFFSTETGLEDGDGLCELDLLVFWCVCRMLNTSWVMGGGASMLKFNGAL